MKAFGADLHCGDGEAQTRTIRQWRRDPEEPRSNSETAAGPVAGNRPPAAASRLADPPQKNRIQDKDFNITNQK